MGNFFTADVIEPSGAVANDECPIKGFNKLIEGKACQELEWNCLIAPLTEIINDNQLLAQAYKEIPHFKSIYDKHFIKKKNTFKKADTPIHSMAIEFVMIRWKWNSFQQNVECPIKKFNELIEGEVCQEMEWNCLIDPLTKIINDNKLLEQAFIEIPHFKEIYIQYFVVKNNTFGLVDKPIPSMAVEFMIKSWG